MKKTNRRVNFSQIPNALLDSHDISPMAKILCSILCRFEPCYPSYDDLSLRMGGASHATIIKYLRELKSANIISWRSGGSLKKKNNEYTILSPPQWKTNSYNPITKDVSSNSKDTPLQNMKTNNTNIIILSSWSSNNEDTGQTSLDAQSEQTKSIDNNTNPEKRPIAVSSNSKDTLSSNPKDECPPDSINYNSEMSPTEEEIQATYFQRIKSLRAKDYIVSPDVERILIKSQYTYDELSQHEAQRLETVLRSHKC